MTTTNEPERFSATFYGQLVRTDNEMHDPAEIEAYVDTAVAELEKMGAEDIDVSTNLRTAEVTVSISVEATDLVDAQTSGGGTIRSAFHAAEIGTPGWRTDWVNCTGQRDGELIDA